jgi:hypothetical protein
MIQRSLVVLALLAVPASADTPKIKGTVGFDWLKPKTSKCTAIAGALLTRLTKEYVCAPPESGGASASGVAIVATCKAKKGESEFMLFSTAKDCVKERETQLANGE